MQPSKTRARKGREATWERAFVSCKPLLLSSPEERAGKEKEKRRKSKKRSRARKAAGRHVETTFQFNVLYNSLQRATHSLPIATIDALVRVIAPNTNTNAVHSSAITNLCPLKVVENCIYGIISMPWRASALTCRRLAFIAELVATPTNTRSIACIVIIRLGHTYLQVTLLQPSNLSTNTPQFLHCRQFCFFMNFCRAISSALWTVSQPSSPCEGRIQERQ